VYRLAEDVKPLPARSNIGRASAPEEKARLSKIANNRPKWQTARPVAVLALNATMRGGELKGLRWRDLHFLQRILTIRLRSKRAAGLRVIPLNAAAWAAVFELRERAKVLFGGNLHPEWYLFFRKEGFSSPEPDNRLAAGVRPLEH